MKKLITFVLAAASVALAYAGGPKSGSCESAASSISVGKSTTVKLVAEYDPDEKEYDEDSGVYFLKVTLSRGSAYTLAYGGSAAADVDVNGYPRETTEKEDDNDIYSPNASFSEDGEYNGVFVQYLQSSEWDSEDPSSWLYYIEIRGSVGASVSVSLQSGIVEYADPGTPDNPTKLTFSDSSNSSTYSFVEGEYHFTAALKAGRFYRIRTTGGTAAAQVFLEASADDVEFELVEDSEHSSDTNNTSFILVPAENATFSLVASGKSSSFGLVWQSIPTRSIAAHPSTTLEDANGFSATFTPGRINSSYTFADNIIDEHLCKITAAAGERWVFSTEGATVESEMRLYDSKGTQLLSNTTLGNGSYDTRIGYKVDKAGVYYVGVCEPSLAVADETPTGSEVVLTAVKVEATDGDPDEWDARDDSYAGATPLSPLPADNTIDPVATGCASGPHRLGISDWADCFQIGARKGLTYVLTAQLAGSETTDLTLEAEVFTVSGTTEREVKSVTGGIDPSDEDYLTFTATDNATYYIRVKVAEGNGLSYPDYTVYATAYDPKGAELGLLQVFTKGVNATWSIGSESVKYANGVSVLLAAGNHTVKFATVNGFATPANQTVPVKVGSEPSVATGVYTDKFDPGDNTDKGAISWTLKNKPTSLLRTLWADDPADHFSFAAADGEFYTFKLEDLEGDAVFSITNAEIGVVAENVTEVSKVALKKTKSKYIIVVKHGDEEPKDGSYTLTGYLAAVGAIKFAKTEVSAKENADSVQLSVSRTAKDGVVRVKYGTVAGTAKPGVDYIAQNGILEWADGDNKAKQIVVKLIPDLVPEYEGNKTFSVRLEGIDEEDLGADEYPAQIAGDTATVTLTEVSKAGTTAGDAYAKSYVKPATVKTEDVPLYTGSFAGLLREDGGTLTNGFPKLAYVTMTASTKDALSAKVTLAGKTYSFSAKAWDEKDEAYGCYKMFEQVQTVAGVTYTNTLAVTLAGGMSSAEGDWISSGGTAELVMNVPDSDNKGVQELVSYSGSLYRDNSKIQEFLNAVTNYAGYYTVALVPDGVYLGDGVPAGNGFVTLTIDAKGKVKVAGQLADGKTKPSVSAVAAIEGDSLVVPVYFGKKPMSFGGVVRIVLADEEAGVKSAVVESSEPLTWYNDDATQTYYGDEGWAIDLVPVGGWYDNVVNLQAYYLTAKLSASTPGVAEFPTEALTAGYDWVMDNGAEADGTEVAVSGDKFDTAKQKLVKDAVSKLYDFGASTNAANVKVSVARATGLVTGSFVVWSTNGKTQKSTSVKHQGVLLLSRDEGAPVDPAIASFGFFALQNVKLSSYNEATKRTTTRNWTFSAPFNIVAEDQGEPDWWADDWGEDTSD